MCAGVCPTRLIEVNLAALQSAFWNISKFDTLREQDARKSVCNVKIKFDRHCRTMRGNERIGSEVFVGIAPPETLSFFFI